MAHQIHYTFSEGINHILLLHIFLLFVVEFFHRSSIKCILKTGKFTCKQTVKSKYDMFPITKAFNEELFTALEHVDVKRHHDLKCAKNL